jgi:hypothetical protein
MKLIIKDKPLFQEDNTDGTSFFSLPMNKNLTASVV